MPHARRAGRAGVEIDVANLTWWYHGFTLSPPDDTFAGDDDLVIEGCGGAYRVPISHSAASPAPALTDLMADTSSRSFAPTDATRGRFRTSRR